MYTQKARDYVRNILLNTKMTLSQLLNTDIADGKLLATVFRPNIIDFDIELATSNRDYAKLNECNPLNENSINDTNMVAFIWLIIVIIVIVIIITFFLIQTNGSQEMVV